MFERIKTRRIENKIILAEAEVRLTLTNDIKPITQSNNYISPEADEGDWVTIGSNSEKGLDEQDQMDLREQAIKTYFTNGHGRNLIRLFEKYIAGHGFGIKPMSSLEAVKDVWDNFWKVNKMALRKKEIVRRTMRDGENFLRYFKPDELINKIDPLKVRFMNPSMVKNPTDLDIKNTEGNVFDGIETDKDDIETVLNYYYKGNPIPSEEVNHTKIFVDSDVLRGRSFYEPLLQSLAMYKKWQNDRMKLNEVRNTVALIKKVKGNPANAANIADKYETSRTFNPDGTARSRAPKNVSVITTNHGVEYDLKSPNLQAGDVKHDGRTLLLAIAAGAGLAEFMVTSDASNANYACYHPDTEILTKEGWQKIEKIREHQLIATVNPATLELNYNYTKRLMEYDFNGELTTFINQHMDIAVTPNHKMFITTRWQRKDLYQFREAQYVKDCWVPVGIYEKNIIEEQSSFILPEIPYKTHPEKNPGDRIINYDDWLSFLGYFISEGNTFQKKGAYFLSISQRKSKIKTKIRELLKRLPFNFKETKDSFYTHDKSLWIWLHENCGARSETKKIPLISMSNRQARIILESLIDGDGHKPKNRSVMYYYSISSYLIDQIQEITTILGYSTSRSKVYEEHVRKDGFKRFPLYKLSIRKPIQTHLKNHHISKMRYQGKVYCVEVPNHLLIVRRNGKVCISGNSTMVAEGPAVMEFEDWQDFFAEAVFKDMFRRVIEDGIERGMIPGFEEIVTEEIGENGELKTVTERVPVSTDCSITFPDLVTRDIKVETEAYLLQINAGLMAPQTAQNNLDLDTDEEARLIKQWDINHDEPDKDFKKDEEDLAIEKARKAMADEEEE